MKDLIRVLLDVEENILSAFGLSRTSALLAGPLYYDASPIPGILTATVRFLPLAIAMILPAVRAVPAELWDAARLDDLRGVTLLRRLLIPLTGSAAFRAAAAVAVLALGEVSASKLVAPPGYRAYVLDLFNQMHYGAEATVAGMCLVQVAMTGLLLGLALRLKPER